MVYIDFEVFNLRDVTGRFAGLSERAAQRAVPLVEAATQLLYEVMYAKAPRSIYASERGLVPGARLAVNIRKVPTHTEGGKVLGGVVLPAVAQFTIPPGTRPHEIRPRFKTWLKFYQSGFGWRFSQLVHHPGYQPANDWTLEAFNSIEPSLQAILFDAGNFIIRTGA